MNWNYLTSLSQLDELEEISKMKPVLIYKHSTSCGVSSMALNRIETKWKPEFGEIILPYFLDLIANRKVSNEIAQRFHVRHESPQVLVISNGETIYDESHSGIRMDDIIDAVKKI